MIINNSGQKSYTAVHYEADENDSGIIRQVFTGDEETVRLQPIAAGQKLAFTDLYGVSPVTHLVVRGVVRVTAELLSGL